METLLGIVRTPAGLVEYRSRRLQEVVFDAYEATPAGPLGRLYETLTSVSSQPSASASQARTSLVSSHGTRTLILAETVPDRSAPYRRFEPPHS